MDICNAEHAELYFPKRHWEIGNKTLSLPEFQWIKETRRMLYGGWNITFGKIAEKPETIDAHSSTRLFSLSEIELILKSRGMRILKTFCDYKGNPATERELQLLIYSIKEINY